MKTILLLRHAKSSHTDRNLSDFDRPLNDRGKRDAPRIGNFILKSGYLPDQIIGSPAMRARQTTELANGVMNKEKEAILWNEALYYHGTSAYLKAIQNAEQSAGSILIVGHNPSIEECIGLLIADPSEYIARVPTGGLICIEHPARDWNQIKPGSSRLQWMVIPRLLPNLM